MKTHWGHRWGGKGTDGCDFLLLKLAQEKKNVPLAISYITYDIFLNLGDDSDRGKEWTGFTYAIRLRQKKH